MRIPALPVAVLLLLLGATCFAADLYVSTSGHDSNDCTSPAEACASIQRAVNLSDWSGGDAVWVAPGTYFERVSIDHSVSISGTSPTNTIVDGGGSGSVFLIAMVNPFGNVGISGLTITNGGGRGIESWGGGLYVSNVIVTGNSGGGISSMPVWDVADLALWDSTVSGNTAPGAGGGIESGWWAQIQNSTITGNSTDTSGGGVAGADLVIINCTITGNAAGVSGGGIVAPPGTTTIRNSILSGNSAPTGPDCSSTLDSLGYNIIQDATGCTLTPGVGDMTGVDPLLAPLQNNGGLTPTQALLAGSPAIERIDSANCVLQTDQRSVERPWDCGGGLLCDIGAFEACGIPLPTVYESADPVLVVDLANAVGMAISPFEHVPGSGRLLYYQVDDGTGFPSLIHLNKSGVLLHICF